MAPTIGRHNMSVGLLKMEFKSLDLVNGTIRPRTIIYIVAIVKNE